MAGASRNCALAALAGLAVASYGAAQVPSLPAAPAGDEVVVNGYPPHCHLRPGDPQDLAVANATHRMNYLRIQPDETGGYRYVEELMLDRAGWIAGPDVWQRAGYNLANYIFRVPEDGTPFCIGARIKRPDGNAHLRKVMKLGPYRCDFIRFATFAAGRKVRALFWLNGGEKPLTYVMDGDHSWVPISLRFGPVPIYYQWVGYGVSLSQGDVWFYKPQLEIIPDSELTDHERWLETKCRTEVEQRKVAIERHQFPDKPLPGD